MFLRSLLCILSAFALGVVADYPNPQTVSGNTAIHDPSLCKDSGGKYWLFGEITSFEFEFHNDCFDVWQVLASALRFEHPLTEKHGL